jgi:hypothetical protein
MVDIFEQGVVLSGVKAAITAVAVFASTVYVGFEDGSLRIYKAGDSNSSTSRSTNGYELVGTFPRFAKEKKSILQLQVVPSWDMLVVLCGKF